MSWLPIDSFGDAFLAGEVIGFIENHLKTCRRCGRDVFYGEDSELGLGEDDDYLCPHCRDGHDFDDDDDYFD